MRERDLPGYVSEWHGVDAAVIRAQRQAELANIAKYRAAKMESYEAWSSPEIPYDPAWDHPDNCPDLDEYMAMSEEQQDKIDAIRKKKRLYYEQQSLRSADKKQAESRQEMAGKYIDDYRVRTVKGETFIGKPLQMSAPYTKVVPRKTWWQRLLAWFDV